MATAMIAVALLCIISGVISEIKIPLIGFGTAGGVDFEHARKALECGYDLIDTAQARDWYDEVAVGYALRNFEMENEKRVFIVSKLDPRLNGYDSALEAFESSVQNLGRLDGFLLHYPHCPKSVCGHVTPPGSWLEAWQALEKLHEEGKISVIGVCNFDADQLRQLIYVAETLPMLVQNWMDPLHQDKAVRDLCKQNDIFYQAYSSLGSQWRSHTTQDEFQPRQKIKNPVLSHATIRGIAARKKVSPAAVVLQWQIQKGIGVIPRSTNYAHICDNVKHMKDEAFTLSTNEMKAIDALDGTHADQRNMKYDVSFINDLERPIDLYYEDSIWSTLQSGDESHVMTYSGHQWYMDDRTTSADRIPWRVASSSTAHINVWFSDIFHKKKHADL